MVITNEGLSKFGFKNIRSIIKNNSRVESLRLKGENYEYMGLDERKNEKIIRLVSEISNRDEIDYLELDKVKIDSI